MDSFKELIMLISRVTSSMGILISIKLKSPIQSIGNLKN